MIHYLQPAILVLEIEKSSAEAELSLFNQHGAQLTPLIRIIWTQLLCYEYFAGHDLPQTVETKEFIPGQWEGEYPSPSETTAPS